MKRFMEENFGFIVLLVIAILGFCCVFRLIDRQYDMYEEALNYAIESNTAVEIK